MTITVCISDGPAANSSFETDAFDWPPPRKIRVVTGGKHGPEILELPEDEPRSGENLHVYRHVFFGLGCNRKRRSYPMGYYEIVSSAPPAAQATLLAQPTLFEEVPWGSMWSQQSPLYSSVGSKQRSQCFSFLDTNDHFSSNYFSKSVSTIDPVIFHCPT